MMIRSILLLAILTTASNTQAEEWIQLFNGKDLTGWTPKIRGEKVGVNFGDTFRVEDGLLKVRFDQYEGPYRGKMGHLFYKDSFSHYRLRAECRSVGDQVQGGPGWAQRNNGLMLHGQTPESMALDQSFPVSLEAQILAGLDDGKPRPSGNLCTPGTHVHRDGKLLTDHCHKLPETAATIKHGEWMTVEIEVRGNKLIRHFINGKPTIEYTQPVLDENDPDAKRLLKGGAAKKLSEGTISIQAESAPFDFRKIELLDLTK